MGYEDKMSKAKPPVDECPDMFNKILEASRLRNQLDESDPLVDYKVTDETYRKIWQLERDMDRYDRPGGSTFDLGKRKKY